MREKLPPIQLEGSQTVSVVVRFYRGIASQPEEWRGQVESVQSSEKCSFHGAHQLLEIIQNLSDASPKAEGQISDI
jgi:hypothetical protein